MAAVLIPALAPQQSHVLRLPDGAGGASAQQEVTYALGAQTPQGTLRNFAPMLEIAKWVDRPAVLGAAPAPAKAAPAQPAKVLDDAIPF